MLMNTTFLGDSFSIKWQSREKEVLLEEKVELDGKKWWVGYTREYLKAIVPDDGKNRANEMISVRFSQIYHREYLL